MSETMRVAERIMRSAQRDLWALADAVLADVPADAKRGGGDRVSKDWSGSYVNIGTALRDLAGELAAAEITKADGTPYTDGYLANLRDAATSWPEHERMAEASFDAHRANSGGTRPVLKALCAYARGDSPRRPSQCEPEAWDDARDKVDTAKRGFKVQVQAVRIALGLKPKNTPTNLDEATFAELCTHLAAAIDGLKSFGTRYAHGSLSKRDRERIATLLARLAEEATFTREVVLAEATDAELAALVESSDT